MGKLGLGAVQFGMDYGINNSRGQVPYGEVFEILDRAVGAGIEVIDTAYAYGVSQKIIGEYVKRKNPNFKIVTKISKEDQIDESIEGLEEILGIKPYAVLFHSFEDYKGNSGGLDLLINKKKDGKIEKIGFSLYYPSQLEYIFDNDIPADIIQVPYSVFDRRFEGLFAKAKKKGMEIHVRSIFLQGVVFKSPETIIREPLSILRDKVKCLQDISKEIGVSVSNICVAFAASNEFIDNVLVGVDTLENFNEIIEYEKNKQIVQENSEELLKLEESNEEVLLPFNWKEMGD